jgi:signal transduction histidine kinase
MSHTPHLPTLADDLDDDLPATLEVDERTILREENRALEEALTLSRKRLTAMREIARALSGRLDLDHLLPLIISRVSVLTGCDRASLFVVDEGRQELWSKVAEGVTTTAGLERIRLPLGQGVAGYVAKSGVVLNLADAYKDARFNPGVDQVTGYRTTSLLCMPIPGPAGRPMGVVEALNKNGGGPFTIEDERLLEAISHQLSVALTDALLYEEIQKKAQSLEVAKRELDRRVQELDLLVDVERALSDAGGADELNRIVVERTRALIDAGAASVAIVDPSTGGVKFRAAHGEAASHVLDRVLPPERGLIGAAIAGACTVMVADASSDARHDRNLAEELGYRPGPVLVVPILVDGRATGAIEVMRARGEAAFDTDDERILALLASRVANAMATARRRDKNKQEEQIQTIGHMLSGIVHDFKTPMTVISGYVQLMAITDDGDERNKCAEIVLKQTDLMTSMTRELLQFARGETSIFLRKVYLHTFARDIKEMVDQLAKGKDIAVTVDLKYRGAARFDETKVKRAVMNLAKNAIEAMAGRGQQKKLDITIGQVGDQVELAVSDTGPGLAPEIESRLFESFATHGKQDGTGLGLALVKKIVEDHHGDVRVESRADGCTFRLRLPL